MPDNPVSPQGERILLRHARLWRARLLLLTALAGATFLALLADSLLGPADLGWRELLQTIIWPEAADPFSRSIVWQIRLPQSLLAVLTGAALGLAGAEMQTILDNPLASPFTLGISSAAAFGAALAMVFGIALPGVPAAWMLGGNAFLMALAAALVLDLVARRSALSSNSLVLFGIALVFFFNAALSLVQYLASSQALQNLVYWTMGSFAQASWPKVSLLGLAVALLLPWSLRSSWRLTALRLGPERAAAMGVDLRRLRRSALARISLLAAIAVACAGTIGFVGLVAPHIARRCVGEDQRLYLLASTLIGAVLLSLSSLAARNLATGVLIPIGIITAILGLPFFLLAIIRAPSR